MNYPNITAKYLSIFLATLCFLITNSSVGSAVNLTRVYQGDDGSAVYLRKFQQRIFGFGEHPGQNYAFVFQGDISDKRIRISWWDVPKFGRTKKGNLVLQWSQNGKRLVRKSGSSFGPDVLTLLSSNANVSWPRHKEAGFQSLKNNDLDGVFDGNDKSRHYVREIGGDVVWVAEKWSSNNRPEWATVFIGKRTALGVAGTFADVPKGRATLKKGSFGAGQVTNKRELKLSQPGVTRTKSLSPRYAIDLDRFAQEIDRAFSGKVTGYGYAISRYDKVVRIGSGGNRRQPPDGSQLRFTPLTQNESASTSKLVTAAIVMRTLEEKGIRLSASVKPYLPSCWEKGPRIITHRFGLSLEDLLTHQSGLTRTSACNNNPYQCLKKAVEIGRNPPYDRKYQNLNYTIFRYILPRIRNSAVDEVFCTSGMSEGDVNANVSERFARHIRDQVLAPLSIQTGFEWTASEFALRYDFSNPSSPGLRQDTSDDYLEAGSGGMKWSAQEFGEFLAALESGKIVSESSLRTMKASLIGFDSVVSGLPGEYYTKNGGALNTESQLVIFPGKVSAYVTINSGNNAYGPQSRANILIKSYEKAVLQ